MLRYHIHNGNAVLLKVGGGCLARWAQQQASLEQAGMHGESGGDLLKKHHPKIVKSFSRKRKYLIALFVARGNKKASHFDWLDGKTENVLFQTENPFNQSFDVFIFNLR